MADKESGGARDILAGFRALFQSRLSPLSSDPPGQKRKLTRMRCEYRVDCFLDGKRFSGQVVDMSLTGMRLEVTRAIKAGVLLSVKYDTAITYMSNKKFDIDTVHTRVVWCRKKKGSKTMEVGVTYTDPEDIMSRSWVKFALLQLGFDVHGIMERRKHVRVKAMVAAELSTRAGEADEGTVVNLGAGGCLFEGYMQLRPAVKVEMQVGPLAGQPALDIQGSVIACNKIPDMPRYLVGIQFVDLTSSQTELLGKYIAHLVKEMVRD